MTVQPFSDGVMMDFVLLGVVQCLFVVVLGVSNVVVVVVQEVVDFAQHVVLQMKIGALIVLSVVRPATRKKTVQKTRLGCPTDFECNHGSKDRS